jgi:hypothetical protein
MVHSLFRRTTLAKGRETYRNGRVAKSGKNPSPADTRIDLLRFEERTVKGPKGALRKLQIALGYKSLRCYSSSSARTLQLLQNSQKKRFSV